MFRYVISICYAAVCSCIESLLHTGEAKPRKSEMNSRGMNKRQHNVFKPREKNSEWKTEKHWTKIHLLHTIYCTPFIAHYLLRSLEGDIYCTLHLLHIFMVHTSGLKLQMKQKSFYRLREAVNCSLTQPISLLCRTKQFLYYAWQNLL